MASTPFIQIIESRTSDVDSMRAIEEEWEKATEGKRTARRSILARDRNDPDRYFSVVFFDSYDSAMENSRLPETQELAAKMAEAVAGAPVFRDLDVLEDRT